MELFHSAFQAIRNKDYYKNLQEIVDKILANDSTISYKNLEHRLEDNSIFSNLGKVNKKNLEEIFALDGDKDSISKNELYTLLVLLDGERKDKPIYDGNFSNDNNVINDAPKLSIKKLYESIKNQDENLELNITGVIEDSYQVGNNCWQLSQVNGYARTDFGAKIIKDAISYDPENNTYTVIFKGDNKAYTYTKEELIQARREHKYSLKSDTGMLIEIAIEDLFVDLESKEFMELLKKPQIRKITNLTDNGVNYTMKFNGKDFKISKQELLDKGIELDTDSIIEYSYRKYLKERGMGGSNPMDQNFDILKHFTGEDYIIAFALEDDSEENKKIIEHFLKVKADNSNDFAIFFGASYIISNDGIEKINGGHEYFVEDVILDENKQIKSVGVNNPHDSSDTVYLSLKEFLKYSVDTFGGLLDEGNENYSFVGASSNENIRNMLINVKKITPSLEDSSQ